MYKEKLVRELFKAQFPTERAYYNYRPDWLKNPITKQNLELDIYYPSLNLAIEIQGIHHKLGYQQFKDEVKVRVCKQRGITLEVLELKQKALEKLASKYGLNIVGIKFGQGTPSKRSKAWNYYKETADKIKREEYTCKWDKIYQVQREERERNKRVRERNL